MGMPEPGTQAYEDMIDFMRKDLESGMGCSKIIEADGRDFDEELLLLIFCYKKWKEVQK